MYFFQVSVFGQMFLAFVCFFGFSLSAALAQEAWAANHITRLIVLAVCALVLLLMSIGALVNGVRLAVAKFRVIFGMERPMRSILLLCLLATACSSNQHALRYTSKSDPVWAINPDRWPGENAITTAPTLPTGQQPTQ